MLGYEERSKVFIKAIQHTKEFIKAEREKQEIQNNAKRNLALTYMQNLLGTPLKKQKSDEIIVVKENGEDNNK